MTTMTKRPCYCLALFRDHFAGARGCEYNADFTHRDPEVKKLRWTKIENDYVTPLPQPTDVGYGQTATQVLRWYNRDERSWVTSYADEQRRQVGSSEYDGSREDSDASAAALIADSIERNAR